MRKSCKYVVLEKDNTDQSIKNKLSGIEFSELSSVAQKAERMISAELRYQNQIKIYEME